MKLTRSLVAIMCGALVVAASQAEAKTKPKPAPFPRPTCPFATDPAGDANGVNLGGSAPTTHAGASIDALDILSMDVGTGKKTTVWILRVKKLAATSPSAPFGMFWSMRFTIRSTTFTVTAHASSAGNITYGLDDTTAAGTAPVDSPITGRFDLDRNEIRVVVPVVALAKYESAPLRVRITGVGALTGQEVGAARSTGIPGPRNTVDWSDHEGSFTPGKPGCA